MSGGVGLRFAAGGEDRKVFEFRAAIQTLLQADERIGLALPAGAGAQDVERWPLVTSFALEGQSDHGTLPSLGFLTMRHPLIDATSALEGEFRAVDAIAVQNTVTSSLNAFREHWQMTVRYLCREKASELSEAKAIEQLSLLYEASHDAEGTNPYPPPRALLGVNSETVDEDTVAAPAARASETDAPLHVVIEGSLTNLRCCRTFFLATGKAAYGPHTSFGAARLLEQYLSLVQALHTVVPELKLIDFQHSLALRVKKTVGREDVCVHYDLRDAHGNTIDPNHWVGSAFAYLRLSLQCEGGAVCVGDTFMVGGNNAVLTGGGCAPYCVAVASEEGFEGAQFRSLSQAARNATMLREDFSLGKPKGTVAGDAFLLFETAPLPWSSSIGQLRLFDQGFALLNSGIAPLLLPLKDMTSMRAVDLAGGDTLLLITLKPAPSTPWHEMSTTLPSILPAIDKVSHVALFLPSGSRMRDAVLKALPEWRYTLGQSAGSQVQDVPPLIQRTANDLVHAFSAQDFPIPTDLMEADARAALLGNNISEERVEKKKQDDESTTPVAVLMGLAGSGVTDALASLQSLCPDDVELVVAFATAAREQDVRRALERLRINAAAAKGAKVGKKEVRLVLGLITSMGAILVGREIESFPGFCTGALATVVGNFYSEVVYGSPYRHFRAGLLDQCAAGWASVIILVDSSFDDLQRIVRRCNTSALVARCNARIHLNGSMIAAILDPSSFRSPAMVSAREARLCPQWESLSTLPRALLEPPAKTVRIRLEGSSFGPVLFGRSMQKIFPGARMRISTTPSSQQWARPEQAPLRGMRRLWQLAERKVTDGVKEAASLVALDTALNELTIRGVSSAGGVVRVGGVCMTLEGSSKAVTATKAASTLNFEELGPLVCDLAFVCPAEVEPHVEKLLSLAVEAGSQELLPPRALSHLRSAEVTSILHAAAATSPLPHGWLFDGTS
jgi:hypothetical protein